MGRIVCKLEDVQKRKVAGKKIGRRSKRTVGDQIEGASRAKKKRKMISEGVFSYEKNVTIFGLP